MTVNFSDLKQRVVTASALILAILLIEIGFQTYPPVKFVFPLTAFIFIALCAYEYVCLCEGHENKKSFKFAYALVALGPSLAICLTFLVRSYFNYQSVSTGSLVLGYGVFSLFLALVFTAIGGRSSLDKARTMSFELTFGSILVGLGGAGLINLALLGSHGLLFWVVAVVIANDTGAYFIGRYFGKRKLSLYISPGKSIEGALGGLILGVIVGAVLFVILLPGLMINVLLSSVFVGAFGQVFDLAKSFIKRIAGVKDSGSLLPGHGGFLDRLDGILGGALAVHVISALTGLSLGLYLLL